MTAHAVTVLGASGFLGRELVRQLEASGTSTLQVTRESWPEPGAHLGDAIFAIGYTGNFRDHLVETHDAHLVQLHRALTRYSFDSFTYMSSTRIYGSEPSTNEDAELVVRPQEADHVYNISKIAGESLCLHCGMPGVRIVRLSNLIGPGAPPHSFLASIVSDAATTGQVVIRQSAASTKDYISVEAAARAVLSIVQRGTQRVYNVASGINVSHQDIADLLERAGYRCSFSLGSPIAAAAPIDVARYQNEFGILQHDPLALIEAMVARAGQWGDGHDHCQ